jgi:hypothetical protein
MGNIRDLPRCSNRRALRRRRHDAKLLALGKQYDAATRELSSLEMDEAASTARIEAFLASMEPMEREILATPADGIEGIAVKARLAAHIVSHYWTVSPDCLDLEARAFRLLIDAVCRVAGVSLPFAARPAQVDPSKVSKRG